MYDMTDEQPNKFSINTLASGHFWGFLRQNNGIARGFVCTRNLGGESGRKLFKGSKDAASLLVCTWKKFFAWELWFFCDWR